MRTTVLVPLHRSAPWHDVVAGNLERLSGHADLLVSDATGVDGTLERLRGRFGDAVAWAGPRALAPGWVTHCNDLVARARTELVMWLPHDDDVDGSWVSAAEAALDADPTAVLALGRVRSLERGGDGADDPALAPTIDLRPSPVLADPSPLVRATEALALTLHGDRGLLGAAFRGVWRREAGVPLPTTGPDGDWADIVWAVEMLTVGGFAAMDAEYLKRWYDGNTHTTWADPRTDPAFRSVVLRDALSRLDPVARADVLAAAWADDVADEQTAHARTRQHAENLETLLAAERARAADLTARLARARAQVRRLRRRLAPGTGPTTEPTVLPALEPGGVRSVVRRLRGRV